MKDFPNILSVSRILLSIILAFLYDMPPIFISIYLLIGLTDIGDGYIARKYKAETNFGAKLDSAGDFTFWVVVLYIIFVKTDIFMDKYILTAVIITAFIRLSNLVFTRLKFQQWNIMHTIGNKLAGLLLFVCTPALIYWGGTSLIFIVLVGIFAVFSALEETIILVVSKDYNPNRKNIF